VIDPGWKRRRQSRRRPAGKPGPPARAGQAVVIGSGPNGLAGALTLARAGFEVEVREAAPQPGGGARTAESTLPGFRHDLCSAIHPMGRSSPFFRWAGLGVDWVEPPAVVAHPLDDGTAVVLERELEDVDLGPDTSSYRELVEPIVRRWGEVEPLVLGPLPPSLSAVARGLGLAGSARPALADARSLAESRFATVRARALFAGLAAHSVLPLERRPSAGFGLALGVLGHVAGWGFPRGGAQAIADALVRELGSLGAEVRTSSPVDELPTADVVLADVMPAELSRIAPLPARYDRALRRYRHGPGAFKLDWALACPIPWQAPECARAATVHLGGTLDEIAASEWGAWSGRPTERPFLILAQHTLFDPSRAPPGQHTAWAYCHVPNGWSGDMTERIEAQVERFAPGFRDLVLARAATGPPDFEARDRNLVGGDVNGGTMDLGQLLTRPAPRLNPYRTPLPGLYLCSSATPPGGGVHGMCGYSAALAALRDGSRPRGQAEGLSYG
jgi:phytoene dehydrogenase-like protein